MQPTLHHIAIPRLLVLALIAVMALAMLASTSAPRAVSAEPLDTVVVDWNRHAAEALMNPTTAAIPGAGLPPQVAILHIAMVQGAVYDAVNSIAGGYQPYSSGLPAADPGASQAAAAATAAHRVLTGVVLGTPLAPAVVDRLDMLLADSLADATTVDGVAAVTAGVAAGEAAANAMLASRVGDGRWVPTALTIGTSPGEWQPTPPGFVTDPFAWVGNVTPFTLTSPSQFRSKGPQALHTGIYAKEYNEVKTLGGGPGFNSRTPAQEALAQFFTVNPVEMYNRAFRDRASSDGLSVAEQARLFAMLNIAGADAIINCFNDKLHYSFWRPVTAIHNGESDGNKKTVGDPAWTPLVVGPPYSDHASGYNCVTGGFMHAAADFFGNGRVNFTLVKSASDPGVTREYKRFADVIDDTIDARIYQGLHFRTADVQGAKIGKDVADWIDRHYFNRVK